uniref:Uncharacterized protein n=1 Tax=Rice yellow mottle virus TaxID=31744 RepID=Q86520_9VIRU|nr:unknown [Rice yellow mottle virus]
MPFSYVGKSGVIFGEHAGKSVCAAVKDAISVFPDLEGFVCPERGSKAELDFPHPPSRSVQQNGMSLRARASSPITPRKVPKSPPQAMPQGRVEVR